jgi:hypothetical protein
MCRAIAAAVKVDEAKDIRSKAAALDETRRTRWPSLESQMLPAVASRWICERKWCQITV